MRILVAGATGLIGSALIHRLAASHQVHALARTPRRSDANIEWHHADLASPRAEWQLPPRWDAAVYLAQSRGYRDFPAQAADMAAVNIHAPVALLEESRCRGANQFVLASSANVYNVSHGAIDERQEVNPTSFYARTRRAAELLAEPFGDHLAVKVARMFTVYGPGQRPDTLIASLIDRVTTGRPVQVQGERGLLLSPVYLSDAVDALIAMLEHGVERGVTIANVAGPEAFGVGELAAVIGEVCGRAPIIERVSGPDPGGWIGNCDRLRALTGWWARTTMREGLNALRRSPA
jgi:UDP-glucuronate 4-epimerase